MLPDSKNDFVMVPVPTPLYAHVIRMIANYQPRRLAPGEAISLSEDSRPPVDESLAGQYLPWTAADYAAVAPHLNRFSRALFDLCARTPGKWVMYRDAVKASGVTAASARSQLSGLSKLLERVFPNDELREGPLEQASAPGKDRQPRFMMNANAARYWKEASKEVSRRPT